MLSEKEVYDQQESCTEAYGRLAECYHEVLGKQDSVIDIGGGAGLILARLKALGWGSKRHLLLDTSQEAIQRAEARNLVAGQYDLQAEPSRAVVEAAWTDPWDCLICTETLEHIPPGQEARLLSRLQLFGASTVIFSAAQPGQEWPGHVNLRLIWYWLDMWERHTDYAVYDGDSARLQACMHKRQAQHMYCSTNFYVLRN